LRRGIAYARFGHAFSHLGLDPVNAQWQDEIRAFNQSHTVRGSRKSSKEWLPGRIGKPDQDFEVMVDERGKKIK
jgi:hypothetical protein